MLIINLKLNIIFLIKACDILVFVVILGTVLSLSFESYVHLFLVINRFCRVNICVGLTESEFQFASDQMLRCLWLQLCFDAVNYSMEMPTDSANLFFFCMEAEHSKASVQTISSTWILYEYNELSLMDFHSDFFF